MQGSKVVERATRTRTKNPERVEKLLEREKKSSTIKARAGRARMSSPVRRALRSVGAI